VEISEISRSSTLLIHQRGDHHLKVHSSATPRHEVQNMSKPTSTWEKIGNRFYRKVQHYTAVFDHDLELENYLIAGAPYGGAVRQNLPPSALR
jgi:hypothetical protein